MLSSIPLLVVPFILYNLGLAGVFGAGPGGDPWSIELFSFSMMSGGVFSMTLGMLMIVIALLLVVFRLVRGAATLLFLTLMVITLGDVLAGFSVSLRAASRDVTIG